MTHHQQQNKPADLQLPDEAALEDGTRFAGTKARVYHLLLWSAEKRYRWPIGRHQGPEGWVPTWVLREPWAGGSAGDRRVRDLREAGLPIEGQPFQPSDEEGSSSWVWRIGGGGASGPSAPLRGPATAPRPATAVPATLPLSGFTFGTGGDDRSAGDIPVCELTKSWLAPGSSDPLRYQEQLIALYRAGQLTHSLPPSLFFRADDEALLEILASVLLKLGARRLG